MSSRPELPWCGHEVVERRQTGDFLNGEVRECFLAAYGIGEPAEFVSDGVTVEGGRWRTIFRSLEGGELEIYNDSTADPLSARDWTRARCTGLRPIGADPSGVPVFVEDGCEEPETVADDQDGADPTADELVAIESLIRFAQSPGAESFASVSFADEVALGLGDQLVVRHSAAALAEPAAWVLDADGFRARTGPVSALEILAEWDFKAVGIFVRELSVTVGPYPRCASPPMPAPAELTDLRRVSVQPVGSIPCLRWWSVDLFLTDEGRIAAATLDLFEP